METCAQGLRLNRFGQIGDRPFFEQSPFSLGIRIGRDEYRWHRMSGRHERVKKLDPVHLRHLHIDNQTAGFIYRIRRQKFVRRAEGGSPVTKCFDESLHRYQNVLVIIYDCY